MKHLLTVIPHLKQTSHRIYQRLFSYKYCTHAQLKIYRTHAQLMSLWIFAIAFGAKHQALLQIWWLLVTCLLHITIYIVVLVQICMCCRCSFLLVFGKTYLMLQATVTAITPLILAKQAIHLTKTQSPITS